MKRIVTNLVKHISEIALLCGVIAVTVGAGIFALPAGLIVGGAWTIVLSVLSIWGEDGDAK